LTLKKQDITEEQNEIALGGSQRRYFANTIKKVNILKVWGIF
jgi:hypothetical protein